MQLRDIELFHSLTEQIDLIICQQFRQAKHITELLDMLEDSDPQTRRTALRNIQIKLSQYNNSSSYLHLTSSLCRDLLDNGGLGFLISQLSLISHSISSSERDLFLEQDLRICLNILYTILTLVGTEDILAEILDYSDQLEEILILLIKLSTEISFLPIKKVSMLFLRYLEIYFQDIQSKPSVSITRRLVDAIPLDKARVMSAAENNVEVFYVRNI
jgi:hypothetical protein